MQFWHILKTLVVSMATLSHTSFSVILEMSPMWKISLCHTRDTCERYGTYKLYKSPNSIQSIRKHTAHPKFNYTARNFWFAKMAAEWGSECVVNLPLVMHVLSVQEGLTEFIMLSNDKHFCCGSFMDRAIWVLEKVNRFRVGRHQEVWMCGCGCDWGVFVKGWLSLGPWDTVFWWVYIKY